MVEDSSSVLVRHMMNGLVFHADKSHNITHIARLLSENNANAIIVRDEGVPVGIVTSKDVIKGLINSNKKPSEILADEIMTSPVITVDHEEGMTEAREIMINNGIQKLPVKRNMDIIGMLVQTDLIKDLSWYKEK